MSQRCPILGPLHAAVSVAGALMLDGTFGQAQVGYELVEASREGGTVTQDERNAVGHDEQRYEQGPADGAPRLSRDESKSKVAQVDGWEPFERIDRSDLDDH